jgi:hypothetical protein
VASRRKDDDFSASFAADLRALARIRLERDLSFRELGAEVGLSHALLHRLMTAPTDRTVYKIRQYLARVKKGAA